MNEINYKNIWNASTHSWYGRALSEHLTMALSPFLSILFIKKHIKPDTITIMMIVCGIIAPILLMVNNIYLQCVSAFLFILWFTLDASDGEVARFTSTFSKHGRDLDYLSHVSCHSLFVMAMWKIYAYGSEYLLPLSIMFFLLLAVEFYYRMSVLYSVYVYKNDTSIVYTHKIKSVFEVNLTYFPNFVVFFPLLYCLSFYIDISMLPFFVVFFVIYIIVMVRAYFCKIIRFYRGSN